MRARLILGVAALAWLLISASAVGLEGRLAGEFQMVGTITASNFGTRGPAPVRTYRFTPLCPNEVCRKVALKREGGSNGSRYRSILRRKGGAYKGKEDSNASGPVICPSGRRGGNQTVRLSFRIEQVENGQATVIRGRAKYELDCRGGKFFQKVKLHGQRL